MSKAEARVGDFVKAVDRMRQARLKGWSEAFTDALDELERLAALDVPEEQTPAAQCIDANVHHTLISKSSPNEGKGPTVCIPCEGLGKTFAFGHGWGTCPACTGRRTFDP